MGFLVLDLLKKICLNFKGVSVYSYKKHTNSKTALDMILQVLIRLQVMVQSLVIVVEVGNGIIMPQMVIMEL